MSLEIDTDPTHAPSPAILSGEEEMAVTDDPCGTQDPRAFVARALADHRQFEPFVKATKGYVITVLRKHGVCDNDLDDVAQSAFLNIYRGLESFSGGSTLKTWAFSIISNTASSHRRTYQTIRARSEALTSTGEVGENDAGEADSPEIRTANRETFERVTKCLPSSLRAVFVLYLEGYTQEEIALQLDSARSTVQRRLALAKSRVYRLLDICD